MWYYGCTNFRQNRRGSGSKLHFLGRFDVEWPFTSLLRLGSTSDDMSGMSAHHPLKLHHVQLMCWFSFYWLVRRKVLGPIATVWPSSLLKNLRYASSVWWQRHATLVSGRPMTCSNQAINTQSPFQLTTWLLPSPTHEYIWFASKPRSFRNV